jgi:PAS domain S-box-containing protein
MEAWLAAALGVVGDAVVCTDPWGAVTFLNAAAERLTGWSAGDALGQDAAAVVRLLEEDTRRAIALPVAEALREGPAPGGIAAALLVARDGSETPVSGRACPLADNRGGAAGVAFMLRDLTGRRLAEEHLRECQKREALGRLAATLGHDLQNLLTAALGNVALVRADLPKGDAHRDLLAAAEKAAERAGQLLPDLLRCARPTAFHPQPFNPASCLREAVRLLRRAVDPATTMEVRTSPDLWSVRGDAGRFEQAILSLARNACAAMPAGGRLLLEADNVVLAEALPHAQARRGEFVRLRLTDAGPGLPAHVCRWLDEPLALAQDLTRGACTGLALARDLVRQHHGWMEYHPALPHGTRFDIYLPRHRAEPADPLFVRPRTKGRTGTVLLATGDSMLGHLGRLILLHQGYDVFVARDGGEALELYRHRKESTDLIILDGSLPGLGASNIMGQLAQLDPHVRVLVAGESAPSRPPGARGPHFLGSIRTPFRPHELTAVVRAALHG